MSAAGAGAGAGANNDPIFATHDEWLEWMLTRPKLSVKFRMSKSPGSQLVKAAENGDVERVRVLLSRGVEVDTETYVDVSYRTAMTAAAFAGRIPVLALLIEAGADVNAKVRYNKTPFAAAVAGGHADTVQFLLEHGARMDYAHNAIGSDTVMTYAVAKGFEDVVRILVANDRPENRYDPSRDEDDQELDPLIERENLEELTPLMVAVLHENTSMIKLLVSLGADIMGENGRGDTPASRAFHGVRLEATQALIEAGLVERAGSALWKDAVYHGFSEVIPLFVAAGLDVNSPPDNPPLLLAARRGYMHFMKDLVAAGADILRPIRGKTIEQMVHEGAFQDYNKPTIMKLVNDAKEKLRRRRVLEGERLGNIVKARGIPEGLNTHMKSYLRSPENEKPSNAALLASRVKMVPRAAAEAGAGSARRRKTSSSRNGWRGGSRRSRRSRK